MKLTKKQELLNKFITESKTTLALSAANTVKKAGEEAIKQAGEAYDEWGGTTRIKLKVGDLLNELISVERTTKNDCKNIDDRINQMRCQKTATRAKIIGLNKLYIMCRGEDNPDECRLSIKNEVNKSRRKIEILRNKITKEIMKEREVYNAMHREPNIRWDHGYEDRIS